MSDKKSIFNIDEEKLKKYLAMIFKHELAYMIEFIIAVAYFMFIGFIPQDFGQILINSAFIVGFSYVAFLIACKVYDNVRIRVTDTHVRINNHKNNNSE